MLQISYSNGKFPCAWKIANITPIHKGGDTTKLSNYRPIALTSVVCKIFESMIACSVKSHVDNHCLLLPQQHGFVTGRSCVTQLMNVFHTWLNILDKPRPPMIDTVFLDFAKAFDVMPHDVLLHKLSSQYNISGNVWQLFKSFLYGRKHRVIYKGFQSSWHPVTSGVPQGSVLGPLLLTFIESQCALFADDTLIYRIIRTIDDEHVLQRDLNSISEWCIQNKMKLNAAKCKVMRITRCKQPNVPNYNLNDSQLEVVSEFKYLGIILNNKLSWDDHVSYVVLRANKMIGFIFSVARHLPSKALLALYKSIVLPILEYGQPVWYLYLKKHIDAIENVQRRATRQILKQKRMDMSYNDRLKSLHWHTLESRRIFLLICYCIKALFFIIRCDVVKLNLQVNVRHTEIVKFHHLRARTQSLHCSALHQFPRIWENLPESLKTGVVELTLSTWIFHLRRHLFVNK